MTQDPNLDAPWSLHFHKEGTEDIGTITDANGDTLVESRPFWLPEGEDPTPPTLSALRLMAVAPKLLAAAQATLTAFELILEVDDPISLTQADFDADPLATLRAVIIEAEAFEAAG